MRLRLVAGLLAVSALLGSAACARTPHRSVRPARAASAEQAPTCRAHPDLAMVGAQTSVRASLLGWFRFTIAESARGVRFKESAVLLGYGGTIVAGRAVLRGLAGAGPRWVRLVLVGRRFYASGPGLPHTSRGKPWVTFGADSLSRPAMAGWRQLAQSAGLLKDPRARGNIFGLFGCSTQVSRVQRVTLGGEAMERYGGVLVLGPATASDPTLRRLAADAARSVRWELWVDGSGLPRRLTVTTATRVYGRLIMDERFSGWGKPAAIKPPPPSMTAEVPAGELDSGA